MTATEKPRQRRGAAVEAAVLEATLGEIASQGSAAISIDQVAARAGVNKTTIYRRWPTPQELVLAAVSSVADNEVPIPDSGDLRTDLRRLCLDVGRTISSPMGRALLAAARSSDPVFADVRDQFWSIRMASAAAVLTRAVERGEIDPVDEPARQLELLVGPIHFRVTELGRELSEGHVDLLVDHFCRGLGAAPPPS